MQWRAIFAVPISRIRITSYRGRADQVRREVARHHRTGDPAAISKGRNAQVSSGFGAIPPAYEEALDVLGVAARQHSGYRVTVVAVGTGDHLGCALTQRVICRPTGDLRRGLIKECKQTIGVHTEDAVGRLFERRG